MPSSSPPSPDSDWIAWYDVRLNWPINYLPSIFRFLALLYIAPVILLSVFDVGGYLLFKLFYKPFGNYPMYSYFKQVPPREHFESEGESSSSQTTKAGSERHTKKKITALSTACPLSSSCSSEASSSEASSTLTSPTIPPGPSTTATGAGAPPMTSIDSHDSSFSSSSSPYIDKPHLRLRTSSASKKSSSSTTHIKKPRRDRFDHHHQKTTVGFDGPMLDFKSPTTSDYEE